MPRKEDERSARGEAIIMIQNIIVKVIKITMRAYLDWHHLRDPDWEGKAKEHGLVMCHMHSPRSRSLSQSRIDIVTSM
jgi:hypothetical protein